MALQNTSNYNTLNSSILTTDTPEFNVAVGVDALTANTIGGSCTAVGFNALASNTSGVDNTAIGAFALDANTTGISNTAVGLNALGAVVSASFNTALGANAGNSYTGAESNNILIGSNVLGLAGESAVTRIGATATMTQCFVGGVYGTISTIPADNAPVVIDSHGRLGALGPLTDGQLLIGSTGANPVAATLTPGSGISITNSAGGITIAAEAGGLSWSSISASLTATANSGYFVTSGTVSITLPAVSSLGDELRVILTGGNQVSIAQGTVQSVQFGSTVTTTGITGSLTGTFDGDALSIVCSSANVDWVVYASQGNWTVV